MQSLDLSQVTPICSEPYPYTELQEKCIRDLETTDAPQAKGVLERLDDDGETVGYCCLGRFCVVAGVKRHVNQGAKEATFECDAVKTGEVADLPARLRNSLKLQMLGQFKRSVYLDGKYLNTLAGMNDAGGFSFKDIAAYIRHDPWNVFTDEVPAAKEAAA